MPSVPRVLSGGKGRRKRRRMKGGKEGKERGKGRVRGLDTSL